MRTKLIEIVEKIVSIRYFDVCVCIRRSEITMLRFTFSRSSYCFGHVINFNCDAISPHPSIMLRKNDSCAYTYILSTYLRNYDTYTSGAKFEFSIIFFRKVKSIVVVIVMSPAISSAPVNQQDSHMFDIHVKQQPMVKILKRPTATTQPVVDVRPKTPLKTLEQREHEYAQARLRILGSVSITANTVQNPISNADNTKCNGKNASNKVLMKR